MGELKNIKIVDDFDEIIINRKSLPSGIRFSNADSCFYSNNGLFVLDVHHNGQYFELNDVFFDWKLGKLNGQTVLIPVKK